MTPPRPRRHERGLVMPPGRSIPRAPTPKPRRGSAVSLDEVPPLLAKAAGELVALASAIRACTECGRQGVPGADRCAFGTGYPRALVMLVAERPSEADLESGNAFTDEAEALDKAFDALGIPLSWVYGTTAIHCATDSPTADAIRACARHLLVEIEAVEPRVIVAFGPRAADAVRALDGSCGLAVPEELPQGNPVRIRDGLDMIVTEPVPEGVTNKDSKRRLWRDLQQIPALLGG